MGYQEQNQSNRSLIISRLINSAETAKRTIGYVVLSFNNVNSNFTVENVPMNVMHSKVGKNEIENATLVNNVITLQGVTEKDLPVSILGQNPQSVEDKVMVLDRVVRKEKGADGKVRDKSVGFRVFAYWGITFVSANKLIESHKTKAVRAINAKVVTRDGDEILSAKRGNFGVIQDYTKKSKEKGTVNSEKVLSDKKDDVIEKRQFTSEEVKGHHLNFRKKSVEFFVKQFLRSGRVSKIKTERGLNFAKIALKEFFFKKFPEMKELKDLGVDNRTVLEVGVVLLLSTPEGEKAYQNMETRPMLNRWVNQKVDLKGYSLDSQTETLIKKIGKNSSTTLSSFLKLRTELVLYSNKDLVFDEVFVKLENLLVLLESFLEDGNIKRFTSLDTLVVRLISEVEKEMREEGRKFKFYDEPVLVSSLDFSTPQGFKKMGYAILGSNLENTYSDTVYGFKKLKSMFDLGIKGLKVDVPSNIQKEIIKNTYVFGDTEITRTLLILKAALDSASQAEDVDVVKNLVIVRLVILARYNLELAQVLNTFMGNIADFYLQKVSESDVELTGNDKVYYESGMKFNSGNLVLSFDTRWGKPEYKGDAPMGYTPYTEPANTLPTGTFKLLKSLNFEVDPLELHPYYLRVRKQLIEGLK